MRLLEKITEETEQCFVGVAVMKKDEAVSWLQQRICGWYREVVVNGGCWGWWNQTLLRLYTLWQLKFKKCVNDSFDVWSSFLYTRSVRKVSDFIFLCEHLMDYNLARLHEPTLNLSAHA